MRQHPSEIDEQRLRCGCGGQLVSEGTMDNVYIVRLEARMCTVEVYQR